MLGGDHCIPIMVSSTLSVIVPGMTGALETVEHDEGSGQR